MKCRDCGQDILQAHPERCPYCRSKNLISEEDASKEIDEARQLSKSGRYEDAAVKFDKLEMWSEAKECRRQARKKRSGAAHLESGKVGTVTVLCPNCGASQPVTSKSTEETCSRCGTVYAVPNAVFDLLTFDQKK
jgi:hypothetical protein